MGQGRSTSDLLKDKPDFYAYECNTDARDGPCVVCNKNKDGSHKLTHEQYKAAKLDCAACVSTGFIKGEGKVYGVPRSQLRLRKSRRRLTASRDDTSARCPTGLRLTERLAR